MKKNILMFLAVLFCINMPVFAEGKTKIAFIILEENLDGKSTTVAESNLKRIFSKKGFIVVESVFKDVKIDEFLIDDDLIAEGIVDENGKIKSLVKNLEAEMVVIGKAVVEEIGSETNNIISYSASITATMFATANMKVLGSSKARIVSYGVDAEVGCLDALERASAELAENLANQILRK